MQDHGCLLWISQLCRDLGIALGIAELREQQQDESIPTPGPSHKKRRNTTCCGCGFEAEEFGPGPQGTPLCRTCLRREDESQLEPISQTERHGLNLLAETLDVVPWTYWKPGEQPAALLDWLYLGDIHEALNLDLLASRGITGVLNLIGWWELQALVPEGSSKLQGLSNLSVLYSSQNIAYEEVDSEDRLFYDIVDKCWPDARTFLKTCQEEGRRVIVHCKAGHNRSACICICWLVACEGMSLLAAVERTQRCRGNILSNHGFRLQLVRLALELQRLGELGQKLRLSTKQSLASHKPMAICGIIKEKRLLPKYNRAGSQDWTGKTPGSPTSLHSLRGRTQACAISKTVSEMVSQRELSLELLACLAHWNKSFLSDYEYTSDPPAIIGSGWSGDVVLCRRRGISGINDVKEGFFTSIRCVKRFDIQKMKSAALEKLENEAVIYLQLEHPLIAQLFDFYQDEHEVSLIMQFCTGGTLADELKTRGAFTESEFQDTALQMLRVMNYIHHAGVVHRDIKPRNWVYEGRGSGSYQAAPKLIDFGFSVKRYFPGNGETGGNLTGCLGTLGYLAPEVIQNGSLVDGAYDEKCDIWSLGIVFTELLTVRPAFHMDSGTCDGYTQEVIMRMIQDVTDDDIERILDTVSVRMRSFLQRLLTKEPHLRASAREAMDDPLLFEVRRKLLQPPQSLPADEVIRRFRTYGEASMPTRASLLAMARAPTQLPYAEFCAIRATFDVFDARDLKGTVNFEAFMAVVAPAVGNNESHAHLIWSSVCGDHECLSYRELLAALLPPIEDAFLDVSTADDTATIPELELLPPIEVEQFDISLPISSFFRFFELREKPINDRIFMEDILVGDVMRVMIDANYRFVVVRYHNGTYRFFHYMDFNHELMAMNRGATNSMGLANLVTSIFSLRVGEIAGSSGYSSCTPISAHAPFSEFLKLAVSANTGRIPIVDANNNIFSIASCLDLLEILMRYAGPTAVLKSRVARALDQRDTILDMSVPHDGSMLHALWLMDVANQPVSLASSRELSGDLGGAVAVGVISVADLRFVLGGGLLSTLDLTVSDFITWRTNTIEANAIERHRLQRLQRFNVVSVDANETLHALARRLLSSKLQRVFLSSDEIARIVGMVSARDIVVEIYDQLIHSCAVGDAVRRHSVL